MQTVTSKKKVLAMYSSVSRRCALVVALCSVSASVANADHGRTAGSLAVSPSGSATYSVPIWTPPGPNGVQPTISVDYNSQADNGLLGVGWKLSVGAVIERCNRTTHQDGDARSIDLILNDRFCLGGNRLRLISGTYGAAGSVYATEFADDSRITAYGTLGGGPEYFIVEGKNGITQEYGRTSNSRVVPGVTPVATTPYRWMLNKASDRNGNTYKIVYNNVNGFAVPDVISWTPTAHGATAYRYEAKFNYTNNRGPVDSYIGRVAGFEVRNQYRLESIQIKSAGTVRRKYRFEYEPSSVTSRSRLKSITECADDAESNCLLPLTFAYQSGISGVTVGASAAPTGSSNNLIKGRFDFNGDGKDDIIYKNGSTWYVAFGANTGFTGQYTTGITGDALPDRYLPNGRDAIATIVSGTLHIYRWNDATSAFVGSDTGISSDMPKLAADYNGDGLADLLYFTSGNPTLTIRRNTSTGSANASFATSVISNTLASTAPQNTFWGSLMTSINGGQHRVDFNGDGRQDLYAVIVTAGPHGASQTYVNLLAQSTGYLSGSSYSAMTGPVSLAPGLNFNGDKCTDLLHLSTVYVSPCKGAPASTVSAPATADVLLDWDGDGKTDILSNNGGTFRVYRSTGTGFTSQSSTTISVSGSVGWFAVDQDGDGLDDLIKLNGAGALSYWTHTPSGAVPSYATNVPDLLTSVTDGFGVSHTVNYVSTASASNYGVGEETEFPLVKAEPRIVVARVTSSNGIGGTYNKTYKYAGARKHAERGGFVGFQYVEETDSRNNFTIRTSYEQTFPTAGMVKQVEVNGPDGIISKSTIDNAHQPLVADDGARFRPYVSKVVLDEYRGGQILTKTQTEYENIDAAGNIRKITETVTDSGLTPTKTWTTVTQKVFAAPVGQCTDFVSDVTVATASGGSSVERVLKNIPDGSNCRIQTSIVAPSSTRYRVETVYGYDAFGNINSVTVKGRNPGGSAMPNRVSSMSWGTLGLFPESASNALGHMTEFDYDYDKGLLKSITDPNDRIMNPNVPTISWGHDAFGRKILESRRGGGSTTWTYSACSGDCLNSRHKTNVTQSDSSGAISVAYLDQFGRVLVTRDRLMNGSYQWNEFQYDALGRLHKQSIPCSTSSATGSCVAHWITNTYDSLGRIESTSRRVSESDAGNHVTNFEYAGRVVTVVDPQSRRTTKAIDAMGMMRVSTDANSYSQFFDYDPLGNLTSVTDSDGRSLFSANYEYGIDAFQTNAWDPDLGARTQTYDSLGQLVEWTDAAGHIFAATYDKLSRMTSRFDPANGLQPEMTTHFIWGANAAGRDIGRLERATSTVDEAMYIDAYEYDDFGRLERRSITIPGDAEHTYSFTYTGDGLLDTVKYPESTPNYQLQLKYGYANGHLQSVTGLNSPATVFWTANAQNARGQITEDTLGNNIVRTRAFDAITGWLNSAQAGSSGNPTSLQNALYQYDSVGNVTQRQNNRLGLTENFYYENSLYRLDYSTLTVNGISTENLSLDYDTLGNIRTKTETGVHDRPVAQEIQWTSYNYPASIHATATGETASFSYGPDRQRWKMEFSNGSVNETTYYIGGLMEAVSRGSVTDYRHYIYAGGEPIAIYSRTSAGQSAVRYLLSDNQGGIDTIASSPNTRVTDESFTAYGLRRDAATWSGEPSSSNRDLADGITRQGYTFQTVLGRMGLNHMNGRVQDAVIGRFISPDPFVTEPGNTQNFNRYAYVYNNPMTYVDPSGFSCSMAGEYRVTPDSPTDWKKEQDCQDAKEYAEDQARQWQDGLKFPQHEGPANTQRTVWADRETSWNFSSGSVAGWVPGGSTVSGNGGPSLRPMGWRAEFFGYNPIGRVIAKPFDLFAPFGTWVYDGAQVNPLSGLELSPREQKDVDFLLTATGPMGFIRRGAAVGAYRLVGGHHIHAKRAFQGVAGYNLRDALAVSDDFLARYGVRHADITAAQQRLFRELAASGAPNTLAHHSRIAYQALVEAGVPQSVAVDLVLQSQSQLIRSGVFAPSAIPWGGL